MSKEKKTSESTKETNLEERPEIYQRPQTLSEDMMAFGAVCKSSGYQAAKDKTGAPKYCNASRLMS